MRVLLALALLSATASAQPPAAPSPPDGPTMPVATLDDTLEVTGEDIAARQVRTRITVPVLVDGQGPFRFIVDSGADRSVVGLALAQRLNLPPGPAVILHGMAGAQRIATVRPDSLEVGSNRITGALVPALPEAFIGADGLLGIDALADQRVTLDFERKVITVQASGRPSAPAASDEIVVTARKRGGQLIITQAAVDGDQIYAIIDSGAQVTVGNTALKRKVFGGRRPPKAVPVTLLSVTGQSITAELAVLPRLKIGGIRLGDVPVAFVDAPPFALFGVDKRPAMLLGTDLLENFRKVALDFRNRRVRFTLR